MKYTAIHDYISHEDLLEKSGYTTYKPAFGSLGKALLEASKNHRSIKWLKNHLDAYFNKLRNKKIQREKQNEKQNS